MKPRTKFEHTVAAANMVVAVVDPRAVEWAVRTHIDHPAFRTSGKRVTCGDCGQQFDYNGKGRRVVCPHCGAKLILHDTMKRKIKDACYFATIEVVEGLQVERVFLLTATFKKGCRLEVDCGELMRLWLNEAGQTALTSRKRSLGIYVDSFNWGSPIELRECSPVHWQIADAWAYPRMKVIAMLRRNGLKGAMPPCHPFGLMKALLTDPRIETLMKAGCHKALSYFLNNPTTLGQCWASYKIAKRHGYEISDYSTWCDLIGLLAKNGRNIKNAKYICPENLSSAHDHWLRKDMERMRKERAIWLMEKALKDAESFKAEKAPYFGIVISDGELEISVLDSIEAYMAEGEAMKHCVFNCGYYNRKESVILSAHDINGNRIETVEFSLTGMKVVQSRGVCNTNTEYHDRIISLVNANAHRFLEVRESQMFATA